ncbi:alpha/beta-hydrolase [Cylindrobasidium torrendii FP15055 ss-10]|uniref:Alpha/beta-hydrolase n=1 Tax=Cylindrobasidium torrendii FP15055 ss-10 TaxID=1314674 RepID=A0A0D7BGD2_9AGAR|nr:alpha/beta-hydrolase [Cylindrobasidium torrendii FP15055 ss-10]
MTRDAYEYSQPDLPANVEYPNYPPLAAFEVPPLPATLPSPITPTQWAHSTHLVPGAYPRMSAPSALPDMGILTQPLSKGARKVAVAKAEAALRDLGGQELDDPSWPRLRRTVLWISLNRYVRHNHDGQGVTLFIAHANAMNKEIYEPMIRHLLSMPKHNISEIWVWEAANTGDSALLNAGKLDTMFHMREAVRDLVHFLEFYLPSSLTLDLPTHLVRRTSSTRASRQVIAVGNSSGGAVCTVAALHRPALFHSLVLIDPVILLFTISKSPMGTKETRPNFMTLNALSRRDSWASKAEAFAQMQRSPLLGRWDPDALRAYVEHGLHEALDGTIRLKMSPLLEAIGFSETWTVSEEAFLGLYRGELEERIQLRWIVPCRHSAEIEGPMGKGQTASRVWVRANGRSSNVIIEGAGHLIPQEKPQEVAEELAAFVQASFGQVASKL